MKKFQIFFLFSREEKKKLSEEEMESSGGYAASRYPTEEATGVASVPKDETLYEQLLRYHNENESSDDDDDDDDRGKGRRKGGGKVKSFDEDDDDDHLNDQKPAARPSPPPRTRSGENSAFYPATKPGIVAVNEPAIHPNSAMYHAAYGGGSGGSPNERGPLQSATTRTRSRSPRTRRTRSRSPRIDPLHHSSHTPRHRSRSPKLDPLPARLIFPGFCRCPANR